LADLVLDAQALLSHSGQTRTLDNVRVTPVKLLIADSKRTFSYVRSGPIASLLYSRLPIQRIEELVAISVPL